MKGCFLCVKTFGKSLFLSTLHYFFEGRRELFKGLYIDSTDWNWEEYPVLHLDLNNLKDITFSDDFAAICGITKRELLDYFQQGIGRLAEKRKLGYDRMVDILKENYDGYRFTPEGCDIYNPWSVLSAMDDCRIGTFWNGTGAPTIIPESLREADVDIEKTLNADWDLDDLAGLDLLNADPTALLYQAGYLTIADYDIDSNSVRLKVPNEEVRKGLFKGLLEVWLRPQKGTVKSVIEGITKSVQRGEPEKMMKSLQAYFARIPYDLKMDNENNFHNAFYILTTQIGIDAKAEVHTSDGPNRPPD